MHASITTHANAYRHRSKRVRARARLQSGLKNLKSARTLTLVPSRAPLAPPRPVRPLALGSSALPACSFPTVGFCSLTGDAPGTLTRVAGARRVAASGTRASVVSQSARSNARVRRSRIHRVARAAITPSIHPSIHPCIHPCVHACVKTTDADIKDADNRPRFSRARPRVQSSSLWVARGARRPPEDDRRATPTRDARAHTHINITHAHTATHARRTSHARRTNTHTTRIASHRIASRSTPRTRSRLSRHRHARTDDARRRRIRRKHMRVIRALLRHLRRRSLRARGRRERRARGAAAGARQRSRIGRRRRRRIRDARRRARRTTPRLRTREDTEKSAASVQRDDGRVRASQRARVTARARRIPPTRGCARPRAGAPRAREPVRARADAMDKIHVPLKAPWRPPTRARRPARAPRPRRRTLRAMRARARPRRHRAYALLAHAGVSWSGCGPTDRCFARIDRSSPGTPDHHAIGGESPYSTSRERRVCVCAARIT